MIDSVMNQFRIFNTSDSYFTFLPTKLNIGATYQIHPKLNGGMLLRTELYPRRAIPSLTFSLNALQIKHLAASVSYSIMNGSYNNVGLGIGLGTHNFTFHAISDNILGFFFPQKATTANIRFGFNLQFGCREKPKGFKYSGPGCAGIN